MPDNFYMAHSLWLYKVVLGKSGYTSIQLKYMTGTHFIEDCGSGNWAFTKQVFFFLAQGYSNFYLPSPSVYDLFVSFCDERC